MKAFKAQLLSGDKARTGHTKKIIKNQPNQSIEDFRLVEDMLFAY